jgi:hypothetical protein
MKRRSLTDVTRWVVVLVLMLACPLGASAQEGSEADVDRMIPALEEIEARGLTGRTVAEGVELGRIWVDHGLVGICGSSGYAAAGGIDIATLAGLQAHDTLSHPDLQEISCDNRDELIRQMEQLERLDTILSGSAIAWGTAGTTAGFFPRLAHFSRGFLLTSVFYQSARLWVGWERSILGRFVQSCPVGA